MNLFFVSIILLHPHHLSRSWLLARSRRTKPGGEGLILSDFTLRLMTSSPSHQTPSTVDVMCWYRHAKLDIAMLITMWSQLTDSLMMGSCKTNNSVWLSIHHTFNIWEVAAEAQLPLIGCSGWRNFSGCLIAGWWTRRGSTLDINSALV